MSRRLACTLYEFVSRIGAPLEKALSTSLIDPKETAFGEIRGKGIIGGTSYALKAGDVMVVPPHAPQSFKDVTAPFL